jgi:hypothetical protein
MKKIKNILKECKGKEFIASYLTGIIRNELDERAAMKIKMLM